MSQAMRKCEIPLMSKEGQGGRCTCPTRFTLAHDDAPRSTALHTHGHNVFVLFSTGRRPKYPSSRSPASSLASPTMRRPDQDQSKTRPLPLASPPPELQR